MRNLAVKADANGDFPTWCRVPSDVVNSLALAAGVAESTTVPALAGKVFFSSTGTIYVKVGGTAAVPTDITNGTASELNPSCYIVSPGDVISVIAPATCIVTFSYYR